MNSMAAASQPQPSLVGAAPAAAAGSGNKHGLLVTAALDDAAINAFRAPAFQFGQIPEMAPPPELCQ